MKFSIFGFDVSISRTPTLEDKVVAILDGNIPVEYGRTTAYVAAVKYYREQTKCDLRVALDYVKALQLKLANTTAL